MKEKTKALVHRLLRKSEKYTKTDMVYLAKGGFWLSFGQVVSSGAALILAITFANFLPKETFGTYKYILSIISILSITSLSGIDTAVGQAVARNYEGSFLKGLKIKIVWGYIGTIIGICLASYYYTQSNYVIAFSLATASMLFPFMNALNLYGVYLSGKKLFKQYTIYNNIWSQIGSTIILVLTVILSKNIFLITLSYFLSNILFNLIFLILTIQKHPPNTSEDVQTISYAKHLSFMDLINTVSNQLDKILVFHFLGATNLAIYTIAFAPTEQLKAVVKNINSLAMPKLAARSTDEIKSVLPERLFRFGVVIAVAIILYILFAPVFFHLMFSKYPESVLYSQILAISVLGASISTFLQTVFQAKALRKELYQYNIYSNICNIIILSLLIYYFGLWGAVMAKILNRFLLLGISTAIAKRM